MLRMKQMASALRDTAKTLGIVTVLAAGFTWFGVYGTGGPAWLRFLMWFITMLVGSVASYWVVPFVFHTHLKTLQIHPLLCLLEPFYPKIEKKLMIAGHIGLPYLPL